MRGLDLMWLALTLPGLAAGILLLRKRMRLYRDAKQYSADPEDRRLARHERRVEVVRLIEQCFLCIAVWMRVVLPPVTIVGRDLHLYQIRNGLIAGASLLVLLNSVADLRYGRLVRWGWLRQVAPASKASAGIVEADKTTRDVT